MSLIEQHDALKQRMAAGSAFGSDVAECISFALQANDAGRADLSLSLLLPLTEKAPRNATLWQVIALAHRCAENTQGALATFEKARSLAPDDVRIAIGHALTLLEAGQPASPHLRPLQKLHPDNLQLVLSNADALQSEGRIDIAMSLIERALGNQPDWLAGHDALSRLRSTQGDDDPLRSYRAAVERLPDTLAVRFAWSGAAAQRGDWEAAKTIINEAAKRFGATPQSNGIAGYIATEMGEHDRAETLFAGAEGLGDPGIDIYRIRHALRTGRLDRIEVLAEPYLKSPQANGFWPYLSLVWRLLGDPRAAWLDGDPAYIQAIDLNLDAHAIAEIAALLRRLHLSREALPDQSVRGGTQTDKPLFARLDPEIAVLKAAITDAVRLYVEGLPVFDENHPLLGTPRKQIRYAGSWSVRLRGQGFHVMHTHPAGWISSACYLALPEADALGAAPAGWLELGSPPPELGLALAPYQRVEPKLGRLVLFPSTMWHGTLPFDDGERLSVAFDIAPPAW